MRQAIVLLKKFFKDCFTGLDGVSYDLGRVLWAIGVLVYCFITTWIVVKTNITGFDFIAWGTGFGAVLASGGAALWMKRETEPKE
jgi:hypothetical protein